jgi:sugar (pentulose or hexulose) kinase
MRLTAVVDIGKTNVKLALVDGDGRAAAVHTTPNLTVDRPPYPHFDVEATWNWLVATLAAEARAGASIEAIVTTAHGCAAALVREDGSLALPVLDYEHAAPAQLAAYEALRPPFAQTASPPLPGGMNLGRQLYWQQQVFPERFAEAAAILLYPQYWAARFSGIWATEMTSLGAHSDLWMPQVRRYSSLVTAQGWDRLLPPIARADARLGPILPEVAAATGIGADCSVFCGIHDSNASLLNYLRGGDGAPFAVVSSGTWIICMAPGARGALDPRRDTLMNVDADGDPVPSARYMGGREFQMLTEGVDPAAIDDAAIDRLLARGAMWLPSFFPGCGPFPDQRGELAGAGGERLDGPERIAAATLYVVLMTDACLDLLQASGTIWLEGSLAQAPHFARLLATLRGDRVCRSTDATGTTRGAWLLTRSALPPRTVPVEVRPQPKWAATLAAYRSRWRDAIGGRSL